MQPAPTCSACCLSDGCRGPAVQWRTRINLVLPWDLGGRRIREGRKRTCLILSFPGQSASLLLLCCFYCCGLMHWKITEQWNKSCVLWCFFHRLVTSACMGLPQSAWPLTEGQLRTVWGKPDFGLCCYGQHPSWCGDTSGLTHSLRLQGQSIDLLQIICIHCDHSSASDTRRPPDSGCLGESQQCWGFCIWHQELEVCH